MNIDSKIFNEVWNKTLVSYCKPVINPKGYVLGGQSGAGKFYLIEQVQKELNNNVLVINGDDFRKYHPNYRELQRERGKDSPKFTAAFAGEMTEAIFKKAVENKYNIVIEGTFRTSQTPLIH